MSVDVNCIYTAVMCDKQNKPCRAYWFDGFCIRFEDHAHDNCNFYVSEKVPGMPEYHNDDCKYHYVTDATIIKTVKTFEYVPGSGVTIGRTFIAEHFIQYLAVDYGTGKQILIDEREGETMAKELTFGEVGDYVKAFEAVNPDGGKMELFAYAYNLGQNAGNVCPKCGKIYTDRPAISRADNETEICPECGQREAIEAFERYTKGANK